MDVTSSNVKYVDYSSMLLMMEVGFHNGSAYKYLNVPKNVYEDLVNSDSKGQFMHTNIKGRFTAIQIAPSIKAVKRNIGAAVRSVFSKPKPPMSRPAPRSAAPSKGTVKSVKSVRSR